MLGREAKIPASYMSKISKEGADFINKVRITLFRCYKEPRGKDWGTMESAKF